MWRRSIAVALMIGILAGGCQSSGLGTKVATYKPQGQTTVVKAPCNAQYVLYMNVREPAGFTTTASGAWEPSDYINRAKHITARRLESRQRIGFRRADDGQLQAVMGKQRIPLEEGRYDWRISPGTSPGERLGKDNGDAAVGVGKVIVYGVAVAGLVLLALYAKQHEHGEDND